MSKSAHRRVPTPKELLDPIEFASRDQISALQTERMKWSLTHAYNNVEHYRKKCQEKGVHPDDFSQSSMRPMDAHASSRHASDATLGTVVRGVCRSG